MPTLIHFFNGASGRLLRVVLGVTLIGFGLLVLSGTSGAILALVGLVPIGLAMWGRCLLEAVVPRTTQTA
jgi:Inner membrane protein YgaP-like, transmembrane domain